MDPLISYSSINITSTHNKLLYKKHLISCYLEDMDILRITNITKLHIFLNDPTYEKREASAINFLKLQANLLTEA